MPSTQIEVLLARTDPQHSWKWVYGSEYLPFGLHYSNVESASLGFNSVTAGQPIFVNAGFLQMPGPHETEQISITFYMDGAGSVLKWLDNWKRQIKDFATGLYNGQSAYKRDMTFTLLDTMGNVNTTLLYKGCFPLVTSALDLSYNESGHLVLSQPFSVDDMEVM